MISKRDFIAKYGEEAWIAEGAKRSAYQRQYYQKNKEEKLAKQKERRQREDFAEKHAEYCRQRRQTIKGRAHSLYSAYIQTDRIKKLGETTITEQWIIDNIFTARCVYCGDGDWRHLGTDRIDNTLPHTPENCICSCKKCNEMRADRFSVNEFIEYRKLHPLN